MTPDGGRVTPPPDELAGAAEEGFWWGELSDNNGTPNPFDPAMSPGAWAALRAYWRGRNKYEREELDRIIAEREQR